MAPSSKPRPGPPAFNVPAPHQLRHRVAACTLCCGLILLAPLLVPCMILAALGQIHSVRPGNSACIFVQAWFLGISCGVCHHISHHIVLVYLWQRLLHASAGLCAAFSCCEVQACVWQHLQDSLCTCAPLLSGQTHAVLPDVQVYAWKQVEDGLRHRAIFSDPSDWPSIKKSRYHGLYDGPFFALHDTLMFLCEGTASFKEMTVRFASSQVSYSGAHPVSCSYEGGGVILPTGLTELPLCTGWLHLSPLSSDNRELSGPPCSLCRKHIGPN